MWNTLCSSHIKVLVTNDLDPQQKKEEEQCEVGIDRGPFFSDKNTILAHLSHLFWCYFQLQSVKCIGQYFRFFPKHPFGVGTYNLDSV